MDKITGTVKLANVNGTAQIMFKKRSDFPASGRASAEYVATDENKIYRYDKAAGKYVCIGTNPDGLQKQIDNIVIAGTGSGDVAAEVAQARVNANGETFGTLKERLDATDGTLKARIDSDVNNLNDMVSQINDRVSQINDNKEFKLVHEKNVNITLDSSTNVNRTFSQLFFKEGSRYKVIMEIENLTPYEYGSSALIIASSSDNNSPPTIVDNISPSAGIPPTELVNRYEYIYTPTENIKYLYIFTRPQPNTNLSYNIKVYEEYNKWDNENLTETTLINHSSVPTAYSTKLYYPARMVKGCTYKVHLKINDIGILSGETRDFLDIRTNRKENTTDISADLLKITPNNWRGTSDYWTEFTPTETTDYLYIFTCAEMNKALDFTLEIKSKADQLYYQNNEYPPITIYGIGDSIMTTTYGRFMGTLKNKYNVSSVRFAEGSTGYSTNNNVSSKTTFYNRVASMPNEAPDLILIEGGTNDFGKNMTIEQTVNGVEQTIINLHSKYPNTMILGLLPTQRYYFGSAETVRGMVNDIGVNLTEYVDAIKSVYDKYGFPTIDLCRNSGLNELNVASLTTDGLHWNDEFHDRISDIIYPEIKRYANIH